MFNIYFFHIDPEKIEKKKKLTQFYTGLQIGVGSHHDRMKRMMYIFGTARIPIVDFMLIVARDVVTFFWFSFLL